VKRRTTPLRRLDREEVGHFRIEKFGRTSILDFSEAAYEIAKEKIDPYSSKFSKKKFTQQQHAVIICLKIRSGSTYVEIVERLVEEPRIRKALELEEVPHPTTLVKAFERLETELWRIFLQASAEILERNGIVGVDASGFERSHASRHYTKRAKLHIQELKTTLLVDTEENAILDVHIAASRKHDTQIGPQLVKRASKFIEILLGDKGYDDKDFRKLCRKLGIRPLIKHREFTSLHKAWNVLLDDDLYGQRNQNESVNSTIGRKYESNVFSRKWYKQFREIVAKCIVHNLERAI